MKNIFTLIAIMVFAVFSVQAQNPFGNGSDGVLTVNEGETLTINSERTSVTGTNYSGTFSILVDSTGGIQIGDEVLIITMQDPETDMNDNTVGRWEVLYVDAVSSGELSLQSALRQDFNAVDGKKHQVVRIPQYTDVSISGTLTCPGWDGSTGGILYFRSNSTVTVDATGIISATGKGYRGGTQFGDSHGGGQGGESFVGLGGDGGHYTADPHGKVGAGGGGAAYNGYNGGNGIAGGGGGATNANVGLGSVDLGGAGGGGGGHAGSAGGAGYGSFGYGGDSYSGTNHGQDGGENISGNGGSNGTGGGGGGGGSYGSADLAKLYLGSGGGCGGRHSSYDPGSGGIGGGFLYISSNTINCSGNIESNGGNGGNGSTHSGGGGGASGGSLYLEAVNIDLSNMITSSGGIGGTPYYSNPAGNGGEGRIRLNTNNLVNTGTISPNHFQGQFYNIIHTPLSNTNNLSGPYQVNASALDNEGDLITEAKLFYRSNGGAFNEVAMTEIGNTQEFTGNIPGQAINTDIDYYLTATDGTDNYIIPLAAPAQLYSFAISAFPPYGLSSTDNNDGTVDINWYEPLDLTNFVDYSIYRSEQDGFTPGAFNLLADNISDTTYTDATVQDFHTYHYIVSGNYDYSGTPNESFSGQSAALLVNNTSQTTVLGYAFLEDRNNHANIKVNFVPESPSAVADSVYTDALGYFETHDLYPGVYSIRMSKPGFQTPIIHEGLSIVEDTDMGETFLYDMGAEVSGDVSGVWSEFVSVTGDITVPAGDSLIIEAGTLVRFLGKYHFYVYGYLACNGADGDEILITSGPANQIQAKDQWYGFDFYDAADDNSYFHYTTVEYAYDGIFYEWSAPSIQNCLVQHHQRYGIYANRSDNAPIESTTISDCSTTGIYADYSSPQVNLCDISNCGSYGIDLENMSHAVITATNFHDSPQGLYANNACDPLVEGCEFTNHSNIGINFYNLYQRGRIINNTFTSNVNGIYLNYRSHSLVQGNSFVQNGDGIEINYDCDATITENEFINNTNGIYFNTSSYYCETEISFNLFAYNTNDGIHKDAYSSSYVNSPTIINNTIFNNGGDGIQIREVGTDVIRNNIISNNAGYGLYAQGFVEVFENNDVYDNALGAISDLNNLPAETWNFVSFNPNNGADCDIYRNINEGPMYVLADSLDVNIGPASKCIDGGSESFSDPDGSISDIGLVPFDHGNPHMISVTGFGNQSVSLEWDEVSNDSIVEYNVYYMVSGADDDYVLFDNTAGATMDVTGLTNNTLYDFTVTGVYPAYESTYAPKVSERPGVPQLDIDPMAYSLIIPAAEDSIIEDMTFTNNGSRDASVSFPNINTGLDYAYFDGSGDYLSYGHRDYLEGMSALTLECWLYRENNGHFEFMGKHYRNYSFGINADEQVHFYKGYGNTANASYQGWDTDKYINVNQWYHLAITWEGETLKLYINGELAWETHDAVSSPIARQGYGLELGRRAGESQYLNGRLAEARVWGDVRSEEEIKEHMYRSLMGNEDALLGYWPLQDDFNDHSTYGLTAGVYGNTVLQSGSLDEYAFYSVPQSMYTVAPGDSEIVPLTFYQRSDLTSIFFTSVLHSDVPSMEKNDLEVFLQYSETVPASPVHFIPVPETGKPYTLVIKDATIDGVTIDVGDEIGVFDDELCVGAGIFDGTFNFTFTAWESDGGLDGFTPGNDMIFKMYDTSADLETNEADETYYIGNDTFGHGVFSALSLEASVYNFQDIAITGGQFNLLGFNLLPHYPDAWDIFGALEGLQIVYNDDGNVLIPGYNINTIGDINFLDGFYLYADDNTNIQYEGTYIHIEDWGITVAPSKWNYISVLSQNPVAVVDVFAGLEDEVSIVQAASGDAWIPGLGVNTIINMQPGSGYKIALAVDTAVTFNYPAASKKSGAIPELEPAKQKGPTDDTHFTCVETGLPYAVVMTIKSPTESPYNLISGDEIGLFDGNTCVGTTVYQGSEQLIITAWEEDAALELPGFAPGKQMQVRVYRESLAKTVKYKLVNRTGERPVFGEGNYANVVLEIGPISEAPFKFEVLPNPFKDQTEITLKLQNEDVVKVNVFDNSGRLVKSLTNQAYSANQHQISWAGTDLNGKKLDPGIYFVIAETTEGVYTEKVIILK